MQDLDVGFQPVTHLPGKADGGEHLCACTQEGVSEERPWGPPRAWTVCDVAIRVCRGLHGRKSCPWMHNPDHRHPVAWT